MKEKKVKETLQEFIDLARKEGLAKLSYNSSTEGFSIEFQHQNQAPSFITQPIIESLNKELDPKVKIITAPFIGRFYQASSPDSPPFVQIGDRITPGQTLAIIEAMKIMNEVEAEFHGEVVEILAQNGEVVEYQQPLFKIRHD